jgi:hypothetical protein
LAAPSGHIFKLAHYYRMERALKLKTMFNASKLFDNYLKNKKERMKNILAFVAALLFIYSCSPATRGSRSRSPKPERKLPTNLLL